MLPPSFFFIFSSSFPFFLPPVKPAPSAPRTWTCPIHSNGQMHHMGEALGEQLHTAVLTGLHRGCEVVFHAGSRSSSALHCCIEAAAALTTTLCCCLTALSVNSFFLTSKGPLHSWWCYQHGCAASMGPMVPESPLPCGDIAVGHKQV